MDKTLFRITGFLYLTVPALIVLQVALYTSLSTVSLINDIALLLIGVIGITTQYGVYRLGVNYHNRIIAVSSILMLILIIVSLPLHYLIPESLHNAPHNTIFWIYILELIAINLLNIVRCNAFYGLTREFGKLAWWTANAGILISILVIALLVFNEVLAVNLMNPLIALLFLLGGAAGVVSMFIAFIAVGRLFLRAAKDAPIL